MTPIDLTDYAHSSKKIPTSFLKHRPKTKEKPKHWKVALSYTLDLYAIAAASMMMASLFELSVMSFMPSAKFAQTFSYLVEGRLGMLSFPLVMLGYFFFSYFFNDGQTWGMNVFKNRIHMPTKDFKAAWNWALYSSGVIFSCGLLLYANKKASSQHEGHDHLYQTLVEEREFYPVNLVQETLNFSSSQKTEEEEIFEIAA